MTEYDHRCQAWVQRKFGVIPDLGSVEFSTDCANYASGGWAKIDVAWTVDGRVDARDLIDDAWQADIGWIIREILDTAVSPAAGTAENTTVGPS